MGAKEYKEGPGIFARRANLARKSTEFEIERIAPVSLGSLVTINFPGDVDK